jgi:hypothetical protein
MNTEKQHDRQQQPSSKDTKQHPQSLLPYVAQFISANGSVATSRSVKKNANL